MLQLTKETQPLIYRPETQPICGLNRVRWVYNQRIRKLRGFDGEVPQVGERVICCRNNWKVGLFNGGAGTLQRLETEHDGWPDTYLIDVDMDDLGKPCKDLMVDPYLFRRNFANGVGGKLEMPRGRRLDEFDLGYLLTAHKAQGSSWEDVTVIDDSSYFKENRHNWLYTSLTRSEKSLTVLLRA